MSLPIPPATGTAAEPGPTVQPWHVPLLRRARTARTRDVRGEGVNARTAGRVTAAVGTIGGADAGLGVPPAGTGEAGG
jgi:hypothetical protein